MGGAIADARLRKGNAAAVTAMALAFAIIVTENATPASALGTTFGAILLGAICGAVAGVLLAAIARKLLPPPATRGARG
jgi:NhaP-type Na+/H+ or K+/H+ antiporter